MSNSPEALAGKLKDLHRKAHPQKLRAVRHDEPMGQPSPMYRAVVGLCHSFDSYVAVINADHSEFDPTPENCEAMAELMAAAVNALPALLACAEAAKVVLDGLNARIDAAPREAVPVFDGIAELHSALYACSSAS